MPTLSETPAFSANDCTAKTDRDDPSISEVISYGQGLVHISAPANRFEKAGPTASGRIAGKRPGRTRGLAED